MINTVGELKEALKDYEDNEPINFHLEEEIGWANCIFPAQYKIPLKCVGVGLTAGATIMWLEK